MISREKAIKLLNDDLRMAKGLVEVSSDKKSRDFYKEKIEAYEMAINQLDNSTAKVTINEFLDRNKNWCIRVKVNDEVISDENIEFISKRGNKDVGQVDKKLLIKTLRKAIPIQCAIIFKTTIILSLLFWIVRYVLQN